MILIFAVQHPHAVGAVTGAVTVATVSESGASSMYNCWRVHVYGQTLYTIGLGSAIPGPVSYTHLTLPTKA